MNLYKIELNGLGTHYVVAPDPTSAYQMIREEYDERNYGFPYQRGLGTIQLLAESGHYAEAACRLWLSDAREQEV